MHTPPRGQTLYAILSLAATQPQLLVDHAEAYRALATTELTRATQAWARRLVYGALAVMGLGISLTLAGVACMLWAMQVPQMAVPPWPLWAAPLLPLLMSAVCLLLVRGSSDDEGLAQLGRQWHADLAMLREVSRP